MKGAAKKTFLAKVEMIGDIVDYVGEHAASLGVHPKRSLHLQLAVEEAVANICGYAYEVPPGEVTVEIHREGDGVRVAISDNGVPFDPLSMTEPDIHANIEARAVGGLGIMLMRRILDEVHYNRAGGKNILSFRVNDGGA